MAESFGAFSSDGQQWVVGEQLAYQGKEDCKDPRCTRLNFMDPESECYGWHCARCDEPCSSHGHCGCGEPVSGEGVQP